MRRAFFCFFIFFVSFLGCDRPGPQNVLRDHQVAVLWANMTLFITKDTPSNSPTFASRALGYMGLTMYESVVHSAKSHQSLVGQLNALDKLAVPEEGKEYNWSLSLNAGQASILRSIYVQTSDVNKMKVDSLEAAIEESLTTQIDDKKVVERSIDFGRRIAAAIFEWSKRDGGHRGYLFNFDSKASYPNKQGCWKAPFFAQTISRFPLHPHWGKNRTFLSANADWKMPAWIKFNSSAESEYYNQFKEVYESNQVLTDEQKEIAVWWNDDPSDTYTPPGHSYNLASIVVKSKKPDLIMAAETYARVGLSVADAFIVCWKMKYFFYTERPSTFITEHIDDQWEPFWPDPPFPAFPSGHATQASAVATVLADLYGDNMEIVDDTHSGRPVNRLRNVAYRERKFKSFWEVAEETAYSRFLGGIHCEYDNLVGLAEGKIVGKNINELKWRR